MNPKKVVYLANPYSPPLHLKDSDDGNLLKLTRRALEAYIGGQLIKKYGVAPLLPIANSASMSDICKFDDGFDTWAEQDYSFINKCDEVWVLKSDGWDKSKGVLAEIGYAKQIDKPVYYIDPHTLNLSGE